MPRRHRVPIEVELPPELDAAAYTEAARNDDLDNVDEYRLDRLLLEFEFIENGPPPDDTDFLRA